jgi:protein required for attachment to host cells
MRGFIMTMNTLILVANASTAKLYQTHKARLFKANGSAEHELNLLKEFSHNESRMKNADLVSDKDGNYRGGGAGHGSFIEPHNPKEEEADYFARFLAQELEYARVMHQCDELVLVASPGFQGKIRHHLGTQLNRMILSSIDKNYVQLPMKELAFQLQEKI